jgi:hypothetical protein
MAEAFLTSSPRGVSFRSWWRAKARRKGGKSEKLKRGREDLPSPLSEVHSFGQTDRRELTSSPRGDCQIVTYFEVLRSTVTHHNNIITIQAHVDLDGQYISPTHSYMDLEPLV